MSKEYWNQVVLLISQYFWNSLCGKIRLAPNLIDGALTTSPNW